MSVNYHRYPTRLECPFYFGLHILRAILLRRQLRAVLVYLPVHRPRPVGVLPL